MQTDQGVYLPTALSPGIGGFSGLPYGNCLLNILTSEKKKSLIPRGWTVNPWTAVGTFSDRDSVA